MANNLYDRLKGLSPEQAAAVLDELQGLLEDIETQGDTMSDYYDNRPWSEVKAMLNRNRMIGAPHPDGLDGQSNEPQPFNMDGATVELEQLSYEYDRLVL